MLRFRRPGAAHHRSYADAVRAAVGLGGDTDTVTAVTGGLAGAVHAPVPSRPGGPGRRTCRCPAGAAGSRAHPG